MPTITAWNIETGLIQLHPLNRPHVWAAENIQNDWAMVQEHWTCSMNIIAVDTGSGHLFRGVAENSALRTSRGIVVFRQICDITLYVFV
jgi:hypothetical protein